GPGVSAHAPREPSSALVESLPTRRTHHKENTQRGERQAVGQFASVNSELVSEKQRRACGVTYTRCCASTMITPRPSFSPSFKPSTVPSQNRSSPNPSASTDRGVTTVTEVRPLSTG